MIAKSAKVRFSVMRRPEMTADQAAALHARQQAQAARLRRLRTALGVSQTLAAQQAGITNVRFNRMESGRHPIDPLALQVFCEAHRIGADYVIVANMSALPEPLRDKLMLAEREEMDRALSGVPLGSVAPDIRARLGLEGAEQTQPDPPRPKKRKSARNSQANRT